MSNEISYYEFSRPEVAALIPKQAKKILEIGCGLGNFKTNIKEDCEYWGVEPEMEIANRAAANLTKVLVGTYANVCNSIPNNYFDLVVCNDVIEHMSDHDWFFQSIKEKMKKENSTLIGSIPNVRYVENLIFLLVKKDWEYTNIGILDKTHLRFFTRKSLLRTLRTNDYLIQELKGINGFGLNVSGKTLVSLIRRIAALVAVAILGWDTRYPQFAFRISPKKQS